SKYPKMQKGQLFMEKPSLCQLNRDHTNEPTTLLERTCHVRVQHIRMADSDCCCIGCIIRFGNCWQLEQLAHHIAYLLLSGRPITCDGQLHLTRSVLRNGQSALYQCQ